MNMLVQICQFLVLPISNLFELIFTTKTASTASVAICTGRLKNQLVWTLGIIAKLQWLTN